MLGKQKMRNITIALPEIYVKNLHKLQDKGIIPSRSEGLRYAMREFLKKEGLNVALLGGLKRKCE